MRGISAAALLLVVACASGSSTQRPAHAVDRAATPRAIASVVPMTQPLVATLPSRANEPLRIALDGDVWLEIADESLRPAAAARGSGVALFSDAAEDTDVVHVVESSRVEEIRVIRRPRATYAARYRLRKGPGIADMRIREGRVEALDTAGDVRFATEPMWAIDAIGKKRELVAQLIDESTLVVELDTHGLSAPLAIDPAWIAVAPMNRPRNSHSSIALADGRVLALGGGGVSTAEVFDPVSGAWTDVAPPSAVRAAPAMVLLASGKVMVAGGTAGGSYFSSVEIFDPASNSWTPARAMTARRSSIEPVVLADGRVLAAGGRDAAGGLSGAEIYDPIKDTWSSAGWMRARRVYHRVTVMKSGKVLVTGGCSGGAPSGCTADVDIYDPSTNTWSAAASMAFTRAWHAAASLPNGKVLVAGGTGADTTGFRSTAELYDPTTDSWAALPPMPGRRNLTTWGVLPTGKVLLAGGESTANVSMSSALLFDPTKESWSTLPSLEGARFFHAIAPLPGGAFLVTGGIHEGTKLSSAEVFVESDPSPIGSPCTSASGCVSGRCVDGVCCDSACNGQCEACDVAGNVGRCIKVAGAPHGARKPCESPPGGATCLTRVCDGVDATRCNALPGPSMQCEAERCVDGVRAPASFCSGAGVCASAATTTCAPYACQGTVCGTSCASDSGCLAGLACVDGACVERPIPMDARSFYGCAYGRGGPFWPALATCLFLVLRRRRIDRRAGGVNAR